MPFDVNLKSVFRFVAGCYSLTSSNVPVYQFISALLKMIELYKYIFPNCHTCSYCVIYFVSNFCL